MEENKITTNKEKFKELLVKAFLAKGKFNKTFQEVEEAKKDYLKSSGLPEVVYDDEPNDDIEKALFDAEISFYESDEVYKKLHPIYSELMEAEEAFLNFCSSINFENATELLSFSDDFAIA